MNMNFINKPSIKIYFNKNSVKEESFYQLLLGIEEEGIPFEISHKEEDDVMKLGYMASIDSILGVGLGISKGRIILHHNKLQEQSPIYNISIKSNNDKIRSLGSNAARLVTKIPFKEI